MVLEKKSFQVLQLCSRASFAGRIGFFLEPEQYIFIHLMLHCLYGLQGQGYAEVYLSIKAGSLTFLSVHVITCLLSNCKDRLWQPICSTYQMFRLLGTEPFLLTNFVVLLTTHLICVIRLFYANANRCSAVTFVNKYKLGFNHLIYHQFFLLQTDTACYFFFEYKLLVNELISNKN